MTQTIIVDPLTRIEGHMRIDIDVKDSVIASARSSGTSFRGIEVIMLGRAPEEAAQITQRVCGVCPVPHGIASTAAVEAISDFTHSHQARLLRNLLHAANFVESHLLSIYTLSMPDWIAGLPGAGAWPPDAPPKPWAQVARVDASTIRSHALLAVDARRACQSIAAMIGGKMPHPVALIPGGITSIVTEAQRTQARQLAQKVLAFCEGPCAEDIETLAGAYPEGLVLGASGKDFLCFGAFPESDGSFLFPGGIVSSDGMTRTAVDPSLIRESIGPSGYKPAEPAHPFDGATEPDPSRVETATTWIKAPRYDGRACEVGPLARAIVAGWPVEGRGVWARDRCRQREAALLSRAILRWLDELVPGATAFEPVATSSLTGRGAGLTEAPRGALGHWMVVENGRVTRYQMIAPTTWNGSPSDDSGSPGAIEAALVGIHLADPADPIEVQRVVHSFDPCVQCAVH